MKTLRLVILFLLLSTNARGYDFGEWRIAKTDFKFFPTRIFLTDPDHAWVMDSRVKSTRLRKKTPNSNGWKDIKTFTYQFNEMFFATPSTGWMVGASGKIIRTPNGGQVWYACNSPTTVNLHDVVFVGSYGWAVGDNNTILHSTDNGKNWSIQHSGLKAKYKLGDVAFLNRRMGWIVGYRFRKSKPRAIILYTRDSGRTWTSQTDNIVGGNRVFLPQDITISPAGWAYIVGNKGAYLMSTDDGKTWKRNDRRYGKDMNIAAISFGTARVGCFVGSYGILEMTFDAGFRWRRLAQPVKGASRHISDVHMVSENLGFATNAWGYILKYERQP